MKGKKTQHLPALLKKTTQICVGGGNLGLLSPGWWRSPSVLPQAASVHSEKRMYRHSSNGTIFLSFHQRRCWLLAAKASWNAWTPKQKQSVKSCSSRHTHAKCCWPNITWPCSKSARRRAKTRRLGGIFSFGELVSCEPELTKWLAKKTCKLVNALFQHSSPLSCLLLAGVVITSLAEWRPVVSLQPSHHIQRCVLTNTVMPSQPIPHRGYR